MLGYIVRRLISTIPVMGVVAIVIFAILRLTPGDPAAIIAGDSATVEQLQRIRQQLGLDQPIPVQFVRWVGDLLQGDLGLSLISGVPVTDMIVGRMGPTLFLTLTVIAFSIVVAVPLGMVAAWTQGSALDRAISALSVLGFSVPSFVIGYLLILFFAIDLGWLPIQGYRPPAEGFWPFFQRLILPTITLGLGYVALIARITRTGMLEVMGEDFVRTARAKGAGELTVMLRHALVNAAVPIVTIIGVGIAHLMSGVVVTETVFNLPGLGRLVVEAVLARDYPVIQGLILFFSFAYILINLLIDISYTALDPRIRY